MSVKCIPLKPHFYRLYVEKMGITGVYLILMMTILLSPFLLFQNIDCGYSLEPLHWGGFNEYPQSIFLAKILKIFYFSNEILNFSSCRRNEPPLEKTNNLHMGKQRRRSASQLIYCYCEADQCLCFAKRIVKFLHFLNPKFPVSSILQCLFSPVCVRPVRKTHCWFSHKAAQISI